jgi:hypothetical protein
MSLRWLLFDKWGTTKHVFGKQLLSYKVFRGQKCLGNAALNPYLIDPGNSFTWERSTAFSPDPVESTAHLKNPIHRCELHLRYKISCLEVLWKTTKNLQRGYQTRPAPCVLCVLCSGAEPGFVGPEAYTVFGTLLKKKNTNSRIQN